MSKAKKTASKKAEKQTKYIYSEGPEIEAIIDRAIKRMAEALPLAAVSPPAPLTKPDKTDDEELEAGLYVREYRIMPKGVLCYMVVRAVVCDQGHGPYVNVYALSEGCRTKLTKFEIATSNFWRTKE